MYFNKSFIGFITFLFTYGLFLHDTFIVCPGLFGRHTYLTLYNPV